MGLLPFGIYGIDIDDCYCLLVWFCKPGMCVFFMLLLMTIT